MFYFWILAGLLYLLINGIITIAWFGEVRNRDYHLTILECIVLLLFGLPVTVIVFIVGIILSIFKWD